MQVRANSISASVNQFVGLNIDFNTGKTRKTVYGGALASSSLRPIRT